MRTIRLFLYIGVPFMGVLKIKALLSRVYINARAFWKLPLHQTLTPKLPVPKKKDSQYSRPTYTIFGYRGPLP